MGSTVTAAAAPSWWHNSTAPTKHDFEQHYVHQIQPTDTGVGLLAGMCLVGVIGGIVGLASGDEAIAAGTFLAGAVMGATFGGMVGNGTGHDSGVAAGDAAWAAAHTTKPAVAQH